MKKDKFKKGDIVEFSTGYRKLSGPVMKVYHSRCKSKSHPNAYLIMTDFEIVDENDLKLKE